MTTWLTDPQTGLAQPLTQDSVMTFETNIHAIPPTVKPHYKLSLKDATLLNIGAMVGSGIFIIPSLVAQQIQTFPLTMLVWLVGGLMSLCGALTLAELGCRFPKAGGQYIYLKALYGPFWGFMFGWATLVVINTGSISALALAFSETTQALVSLSDRQTQAVAIGVVLALTMINALHFKTAVALQNVSSLFKLLGLVFIIVVGMAFSSGHLDHQALAMPFGSFWSDLWQSTTWMMFAPALLTALWAYDGWIQVTFIASEVEHPTRNLPKAMVLSMVVVIGLYLLVNLAYARLLPWPNLITSKQIAVEALTTHLGLWGHFLMLSAILVSTLGACHAYIYTGARVYHAMAKEGQFFQWASIHNRFGLPWVALVVQAVLACTLIGLNSFQVLIAQVIAIAWVFYLMSAMGVVRMRHAERQQQQKPVYTSWGYPFTVILFATGALALLLCTFISNPIQMAYCVGFLGLGYPIYRLWNRFKHNRYSP